MSETPFMHPSDDELLSAYLDGELTEDERAKVEQRLRDDPSAKALVDQLRELSQTVQSLPRLSASKDLRQAVLQQVLSSPVEKRPLSWSRRLLWPVLAVAAVLMLMLYRPQDDDLQDAGLLADATQQQRKSKPKIHEVPQLKSFDDKTFSHSNLEERMPLKAESSGNSPNIKAKELGADKAVRRKLLAASPDSNQRLEKKVDDRSKVGGETLKLPSSPAAEVYQVRLTLNRSQWGNEQLDRLLLSHDIAVRESQPPSKSLAEAESNSNESEVAGQNTLDEIDLSRSRRKKLATERVLLEASPDQIESLLADLHADVAHCLALQIDTPDGRWQRWQRNRRSEESAKGVASVLGSLDSSSGKAPSETKRQGNFKHNGAKDTEHHSQASPVHPRSAKAKSAAVVRMVLIIHWQNVPTSGEKPPAEAEEKHE